MVNLLDYGLNPHQTNSLKIGQVYGRLKVLAIGKNPAKKRAVIIVQCSCGSPPKPVEMNNLRSGKTVSCGCFATEQRTTHGYSKHPLFMVWLSMKYRCSNPKFIGYDIYGGRGIKVCERWHNIDNFITDMYPTFKKGLQVERIDNNGDYTPNNCKWATHSEQSLNRRSCHKITFQGKTMSISEWAKRTGIKYNTLSKRILTQGLSPEEALTRKVLTLEQSARNAIKCRWSK